MTVLQFTALHDWETVKNVVTENSLSKKDQLDSEGKGAEQSSNAYSSSKQDQLDSEGKGAEQSSNA